MRDFVIEKAKACAFSGHRILENGFSTKQLEFTINYLLNNGYNQFLVGMALGFDTICFHYLEKIKTSQDIKIIACIPCKSQAQMFSLKQKAEYERMLSVADMTVFVSQEYSNTCMQKRNRFMVDNASCLVAHIIRDKSGTANTIRYAEKQGVKVYYV